MTTSFETLLSMLDPNDRDAAGREYELLRAKLIKYFEWRNCDDCDELADAVFERVQNKLETDEGIENIRAYAFGIANFVRLEHYRDPSRQNVTIEDESDNFVVPDSSIDSEKEKRLDCLTECMTRMDEEDRALLVRYHDEDNGRRQDIRKAIADELKVSVNTLRIRACRLRSALESCIRRCSK
ncbi:MAG: hypothetical protein QM785_01365 [Pyrinomonadaceae bacterium]